MSEEKSLVSSEVEAAYAAQAEMASAERAERQAKPRRPDDDYATPQPLADAICARLAALLPTPEVVVEPSAGAGNFVRAVHRVWPTVFIWANDVRPRQDELMAAGARVAHCLDWIEFAPPYPPHTVYPFLQSDRKSMLIVGNPPFSLAEKHITAGLDVLRPGDHLAFLLRLSILGGRKRSETLWSRPGFRYLIPIAGRPSFTDDGRSDSSEYAVFCWEGDHVGRAEVLQPLTWKVKTARRIAGATPTAQPATLPTATPSP